MVVSRKGELTILPIAADDFSLREDYYKVFEGIVGEHTNGIHISEYNAFSRIQKALDEYLKK